MRIELECIGEIIGLRLTPPGTREFWGLFAEDAAPRREKVRVADHTAASAEIARLQALSVTHILLAVVPGDGSGQEVYAQSVADVEDKLSELGERAEEADSLKAQLAAQQALVVELADALQSSVAMIDNLNSAYGSENVDRVARSGRAALAKVGR